MTAKIISLADHAWQRWHQHKLREEYDPTLRDDPRHVGENARLWELVVRAGGTA